MTQPAYADAELILAPWLESTLGVRCVTDLPADLQGEVPLVRVVEVPTGGDDEPTLDRVRVDIEAFVGPDGNGNPNRAAAKTLGERVRAAMRYQLPGTVFPTAVAARVDTFMRPTVMPWPDQSLRRVVATYDLILHSRL